MMRPIDVSACWNSLGKLVRRDPRERAWLRDELRRRPQTLQPLLDSALEVLPRATAQPVANVAHGLAVLDDRVGFHANPEVWRELAKAAVPRLGDFKSQELTNTVWAFATAGVPAPTLFATVAKAAVPRLGDFTPQNLANTAWAFATAGVPAPTLFAAVANEAAPRLRDFTPQALANTAWAFATAGVPAPPLFAAVAKAAVPRLGDFTPQNLSNTAWAFATAGVPAPTLFSAVANEAAPRLGEFKSQALANTVWAFATAGVPAPKLFAAVAKEAAPRLGDFAPQELAKTAWAFAVADVLAPQLFGPEFAARCEALPLDHENLSQLHQWQLWLAERGLASPLSAPFSDRCRNAFVSGGVHVSKLQREVVSSLSRLGLSVEEEVLTESGYSLDAVIEHGDARIVVEVNGPSHFIGQDPSGATLLKRRQLRSFGWALLSVPYWEWDALGGGPERQGAYLQDALAREALPAAQSGSAPPTPSASEPAGDLCALTVPQLKERLREKGLRVSGRKAELIDRLLVCSARDRRSLSLL